MPVKVGETVKDGQFTWNTYYDKSSDRFIYKVSDGQGGHGEYSDHAGMSWPFDPNGFWGAH